MECLQFLFLTLKCHISEYLQLSQVWSHALPRNLTKEWIWCLKWHLSLLHFRISFLNICSILHSVLWVWTTSIKAYNWNIICNPKHVSLLLEYLICFFSATCCSSGTHLYITAKLTRDCSQCNQIFSLVSFRNMSFTAGPLLTGYVNAWLNFDGSRHSLTFSSGFGTPTKLLHHSVSSIPMGVIISYCCSHSRSSLTGFCNVQTIYIGDAWYGLISPLMCNKHVS